MIGHLFCLLIKFKKFFTHFARRVVHVCEALNGLETAKYRSNDIQTIIQTLFNKTNFLSFPFFSSIQSFTLHQQKRQIEMAIIYM
jgi:hypothetical protein